MVGNKSNADRLQSDDLHTFLHFQLMNLRWAAEAHGENEGDVLERAPSVNVCVCVCVISKWASSVGP